VETGSRRVAVIGAGPSGLATVKELLEEGHQPTCFERAASLGGVFRFAQDEGVVWESCRLTSSGLLTAFSDFPVTPDHTGHMKVGEYVEYLGRYCTTFGVHRHLRFGSTVEAVERKPSRAWTVRWTGADGRHEEAFDAVAVCSGLHQHPHEPRFPGQETFPGAVIHGAQYRRPSEISGKRVLIVGAGESGADIVAEVANHAAETVLSLRRGVAVQARFRFGKPGDYRTSRLANSPAHWVAYTRNPADNWKRNLYRTVFLPLVIVDKCLQLLYRAGWEYLPLVASGSASEIGVNIRTKKLIAQLLADSGGVLTEQFGTKSDDFVRAIARGQCRLAQALARFEGPRAIFEDGGEFEPDVVILCTGFETKIPFLEPESAQAPRFLHTFHPRVGADLAFVGFLRPAFGAIPPLAELQARWFALLQSGRLQLPPQERMQASIEYWMRSREHNYHPIKGRLEHLVDHAPFCDALAAEIGCKPSRAALRNETLGFRLRTLAGPFVAAQYRLVGPHAKPAIAREVIGALPIVHPAPELINHYLRWQMSRALHRVLGPEFAPKLAIQ
jgi:dimethylaniline monooxygenase (N-oxide forming)